MNERGFTGNLRKADFQRRDLSGVVFRDADLYRANFAGADLTGTEFTRCFVAEATFEKANCAKLQAHRTNFYRACFAGADLQDALLWRCIMAGADLRGARIRRLTITLDCNSLEEVRVDRRTSAELAYLIGRMRSAHRQRWLDNIRNQDLALLERVFQH